LIDVMDRDVDAALPAPLRERLTLTLDAMASPRLLPTHSLTARLLLKRSPTDP
jgi:hypothetical protein